MIEVKNLTKKFVEQKGELLVLDKITFEVQEGEFVSIIGPVGCGKSTLLNIIGGIESPSDGEVLIYGGKVTSPRPEVSMIFQGSVLFPWKTVWENVALPIKHRYKSLSKIETLVEKSLEKVGLKNFGYLYPRQLSGGMKQKTSFARILVSSPKILLLDEPFSALDAITRTLMQEELLKFWEETKFTTLFVTHNLEEALFLADKVIVLSSLPTKVLRIINVNLPRPRNQQIKLTKEFNELKDIIWKILIDQSYENKVY